MINSKKITFIICVNDTQYCQECVRYIRELYMPDGYTIDIIYIQKAESMAMGYNTGMNSSDAKYKVYLHQDTFIINRNFISDIIKIFQQDEKIGMIGVIGSRHLPEDANCFLAWNIGSIMAYDGHSMIDGKMAQNPKLEYVEVEAVDGAILITQYDILWREDILNGWDFYDISQCLEMHRRGYKVVVPYQKEAWCYHDCGVSKLTYYDHFRDIMIKEYGEKFKKTDDFRINFKGEGCDELREKLIEMVDKKKYHQLQEIASAVCGVERGGGVNYLKDTQIREILNLINLYTSEKEQGEVTSAFLYEAQSWNEMYKRYTWLRAVIRRIQFKRTDERIEELKQKLNNKQISLTAIKQIAMNSLESYENVLAKLY